MILAFAGVVVRRRTSSPQELLLQRAKNALDAAVAGSSGASGQRGTTSTCGTSPHRSSLRVFLAHVRATSRAKVQEINCHSFIGRGPTTESTMFRRS